mmetsp:Transcript_54132/g.150182  ORF Transcript_54132/g.150182 Transcript_54132/m.150182 type:complete len:242 (+) Transcript_54132:47-772(+)
MMELRTEPTRAQRLPFTARTPQPQNCTAVQAWTSWNSKLRTCSPMPLPRPYSDPRARPLRARTGGRSARPRPRTRGACGSSLAGGAPTSPPHNQSALRPPTQSTHPPCLQRQTPLARARQLHNRRGLCSCWGERPKMRTGRWKGKALQRGAQRYPDCGSRCPPLQVSRCGHPDGTLQGACVPSPALAAAPTAGLRPHRDAPLTTGAHRRRSHRPRRPCRKRLQPQTGSAAPQGKGKAANAK